MVLYDHLSYIFFNILLFNLIHNNVNSGIIELLEIKE